MVRVCIILALLPAVTLAQATAGTDAPAASNPSSLIFVENAGQFVPGARFQVWGGGASVWLAEDAIWLTLIEATAAHSLTVRSRGSGAAAPAYLGKGVHIKLTFPGANPHPHLEPFNRLETHVSYFNGDDPARWRANVPAWGGVRYVGLYPGIDLVLTGEGAELVPRLVVRSAGDLRRVRLQVDGAETVAVAGSTLRLGTAAGEATVPLLHAEGPAAGVAVRRRGALAFEVAEPFAPADLDQASAPSLAGDASQLLYGTYLGGSSGDWGESIAVDKSGATYVGGATQSTDFPVTAGAFDTAFNGEHDATVLKLDAAGTALVYATFLGGSDGDSVHGLAVDESGAAYVTGHTDCYGFPSTPGAYDTTCNSNPWGGDAFVVKLNPDGMLLEYATFLGGSIQEGGFGITVDGSGAAYIMGVTGSSDFSTTPGAFDTEYNGGTDAFVAKLNAAGSDLEYATFLGGSADEWSTGIALDGSGAAYVTGETTSTNFPATPDAFDTSYGGGEHNGDAFVAKLNAAGSALDYATFLGGSDDDSGSGIAVDGSGAAYATGFTYSSDFPTTPGAFDTAFGGTQFYGDAFVAKLDAAGSALDYATFLGGSLGEVGSGIAVGSTGAATVTGETASSDFPATPNGFDTELGGGLDAFAALLNTTGSRLDCATFLGGSGDDFGPDITVDEGGVVYITGETASSDFPTTPGGLDADLHGGPHDAFLVKLAMEPKAWIYYLPVVLQYP